MFKPARAGCALVTLVLVACSEPAATDRAGTRKSTLVDDPLDGQCSQIISAENGRYLDAYPSRDGNVVTRPVQDNDTQLWCFTRVSDSTTSYTIQHRSFQGQFLDAHVSATDDYRVVLRDGQSNATQVWELVGDALVQTSNGRFLDAYTTAANDFQAVTRPQQNDATQDWLVAATSGAEEPGDDNVPACSVTAGGPCFP